MKQMGGAHAALVSITRNFGHISKWQSPKVLQAYICTPEFIDLFAKVPPNRRESVCLAYVRALEACRKRFPVPPVGVRVEWTDTMVTRYRDAHAKFNGDDWLIARELGISVGAAHRARFRFIDAKAPNLPCGSRSAPEVSRGVPGNASPA